MLSDILQHVAEVVGVQPNDDNKRAYLLRIINRAAQEIYDSADLPNSLADRILDIQLSEPVNAITLPWYVDGIRAARYYNYGGKIKLSSQQPRFQHYSNSDASLQWRIVGTTPLERAFNQASQLRFTIEEVEATPVVFTVVGQTSVAARTVEEITLPAGSLEVTSARQWVQESPMGIESISKNRITDTNVKIETTVNDQQVATLYNRAFESSNTKIVISEDREGLQSYDAVHILYKKRFIPFYLNQDVFCEPKLEDAIVWKVREHWYSMKDGQQETSILAHQKCEQLITRIVANLESATEKRIMGAPNPFHNAVLNYVSNS